MKARLAAVGQANGRRRFAAGDQEGERADDLPEQTTCQSNIAPARKRLSRIMLKETVGATRRLQSPAAFAPLNEGGRPETASRRPLQPSPAGQPYGPRRCGGPEHSAGHSKLSPIRVERSRRWRPSLTKPLTPPDAQLIWRRSGYSGCPKMQPSGKDFHKVRVTQVETEVWLAHPAGGPQKGRRPNLCDDALPRGSGKQISWPRRRSPGRRLRQFRACGGNT